MSPAIGAEKSYAAVDLGASSGRVMRGIVGTAGIGRLELVEVKRFRNGPVPVGDRLYWDVLGLWQDIVDGLSTTVRDDPAVAGIGIDTWAVDYGLVDHDGLLLGNPRNYRDARTTGVAAGFDDVLSRAALYRRNGLQYLPFNTMYQYLSEQRDSLWANADRALLIPDLLAYWLTGVQVAEVTNASTTGLIDPTTRRWADDLISLTGLPSTLLPPLVEPGTMIGTVGRGIGTASGLIGLDVVAVGSHDTASAVVGVPAVGADFAYIACGTWGLVGVELDRPILTEASQKANFTNELGVDGTVRYLRNVMGLWVLQQCHAEWRRHGDPTDIAGVVAMAAAQPAGGPVVDIDDPSLLVPGDMVDRVRALCGGAGLRVPETVGQVARCVIDSLAHAFARTVHQATQLSGHRVEVIHLVGGGAQNALLCQLTADIAELPVVAGPVEATALGNVLVQARAHSSIAGGLDDLRALLRRTQALTTYRPRG